MCASLNLSFSQISPDPACWATHPSCPAPPRALPAPFTPTPSLPSSQILVLSPLEPSSQPCSASRLLHLMESSLPQGTTHCPAISGGPHSPPGPDLGRQGWTFSWYLWTTAPPSFLNTSLEPHLCRHVPPCTVGYNAQKSCHPLEVPALVPTPNATLGGDFKTHL